MLKKLSNTFYSIFFKMLNKGFIYESNIFIFCKHKIKKEVEKWI